MRDEEELLYTIKEVAAAAGVSIGTVSNVINGKTRNVELIERVEKAIKKLSYRPDANARSLKNTKSQLIGVVLPDLVHPGYAILLASMTQMLQDRGYDVLLKISRSNRDIERQCVEQCVEKRVDGLLVHTPLDPALLASTIPATVPLVCITHSGETDPRIGNVRVDYTEAFRDAFDSLAMMGIRNVGMVLDREMLVDGGVETMYFQAFGKQSRKYLRIVDRSRERGFKAAYELVFAHPEVESIIAGSPLIADGVAKALDILGRVEIPITAVKDGNWIEDEGGFSSFISISHDSIAETAIDTLLARIERNKIDAPPPIAAAYEVVPSLTGGISRHSGKLHFAMFDCPTAQALVELSGAYSRQSGVRVSFDLMGYDALESLLYANDRPNRYDGYMFDLVWLPDLAESGVLLPLEEYHGMATPINSGFLDGVVEQYSVYDHLLLGLPFMSGAEFLYYQKNIFEDSRIGRLYERLTGAALRPPTTWEEFNAVAAFFTRDANPESPVKFGAAMISGKNVFTPVGFLPYLWSFGGDLFDAGGDVVVNSPAAAQALACFVEGFRYSAHPARARNWSDIVEQFQAGDYAMAILYDSHAVALNDYTRSIVAGNLGFTTIPGGVSAMGGWNLGLSPEAKNRAAALEFIRWACGDQSALPMSLLGGSPLRKNCFEREDIRRMYPWKAITGQSHAQGRQRVLPAALAGVVPPRRVYVDILATEITRCVNGKATVEKTLEAIERKLLRLKERARGS